MERFAMSRGQSLIETLVVIIILAVALTGRKMQN